MRKTKKIEIWVQSAKDDPFYYFEIIVSKFKNLKEVIDEISFNCLVDDLENLPEGIKLIERSERRNRLLSDKCNTNVIITPNLEIKLVE